MRKIEIIKKLIRCNYDFIKKLFRDKAIHETVGNYDVANLHETVHRHASPCFVLSTGRCGTQLLTQILNKHSSILAYHTPTPEFTYYSRFAYETTDSLAEQLKLIADSGRYEYVRDAYLSEHHFAETNNRITFFAPALAELYPKSRFIHLIRHPASFVNSGISRDWYSGNVLYDESRITPSADSNIDWKNMTRSEKITWLWNETNQFIEDFKDSLDTHRHITVKSEELFNDVSASTKIFDFLQLSPLATKTIWKQIRRPVNKGQNRSSEIDINKNDIQTYAPLMNKYY